MTSPRDFQLPTTNHRAHLPQWMTPGGTIGNLDAPLCSFARNGWALEDSGGGKPLCAWCIKSLGWSLRWANEILVAALGEGT